MIDSHSLTSNKRGGQKPVRAPALAGFAFLDTPLPARKQA
jgi:hypothetical protein